MRDLFVFSGQSNMMGACALPAKGQLDIIDSYEYKHKNKRLYKNSGDFVKVSFNVGEFSYVDLKRAYPDNNKESSLNDYSKNTFFCPAMANAYNGSVVPFSSFSESNYISAPSIPAYFTKYWETFGRMLNFCSLSKGSVGIRYFFDDNMIKKVNEKIILLNENNQYDFSFEPYRQDNDIKASEYFSEKIRDFITDSIIRYGNELSGFKMFVFLQGENDADMPKDIYKIYLEVLFDKIKSLGLDYFLIIRVGFWDNKKITNIMQAQEEFCKENENAYLLTRLLSYFPFKNTLDVYTKLPSEYYNDCRDTYYGYNNPHINAKGIDLLAKISSENTFNIISNKVYFLEEEIVKDLAVKEI